MTFDSIFKLILFLIGLGILVVTIWNLITLRRLSKTRVYKDTQLNDSKYFELKYKYEFIVAIFTLIVAILSFLGFNSYNNLKENFNTEIREQVKNTIDSLSIQKKKIIDLGDTISYQSKKVLLSNELIKSIEKEQAKLSKQINYDKNSVKLFQDNIERLKERISNVQNKNILKQELYIVKDLEYNLSDEWVPRKIEFKDLKTINNENLPSFNDLPIIIPFTNDGFSYVVSHVTKKSFQITAVANSQLPSLPKTGNFSLLISVIY